MVFQKLPNNSDTICNVIQTQIRNNYFISYAKYMQKKNKYVLASWQLLYNSLTYMNNKL